MGRVIGRDYTDKPVHKHDCPNCKFQFGIVFSKGTTIDNLKVTHKVDVYKQCTLDAFNDEEKGKIGEDKYLIRWSSHGPDYTSGLGIKSLCAGYFSNMNIEGIYNGM